MLLAVLHYEKGEHQKGIDVLQRVQGSADDAGSGSAVLSLIADGYSQLGKPKEAAEQYRRAAESARFAGERSFQLSKAARALATAGDTAGAREIWERLANEAEFGANVAAEARVRLGELTAAPAKRS